MQDTEKQSDMADYGLNIKGESYLDERYKINCVKISKNDWEYEYSKEKTYTLNFDKKIKHVCLAITDGMQPTSFSFTNNTITLKYYCSGTAKHSMNDERSYFHLYIWYVDNNPSPTYGINPNFYNTSKLGNKLTVNANQKIKISRPYAIIESNNGRYLFNGDYLEVKSGSLTLQELILNNSIIDDYGIVERDGNHINSSIKSSFVLNLKPIENSNADPYSKTYNLANNERVCLMPYLTRFLVGTTTGTRGGVGFLEITITNKTLTFNPPENLLNFVFSGMAGQVLGIRHIPQFQYLVTILI